MTFPPYPVSLSLAWFADSLIPLVTSAKQCRDPCSAPQTDSTNYWKIYMFWISFQPDWQIDNSFFSRPIKVDTQTLVHMWARTRTLALFGRRTLPEVLVCLVLLVAQPTLSRATKTLFLLMFIKYSCICLCNFFKYICMYVCPYNGYFIFEIMRWCQTQLGGLSLLLCWQLCNGNWWGSLEMTITSHTALKPKMVGKSLLLETSTKSMCIKFRISISILSEV